MREEAASCHLFARCEFNPKHSPTHLSLYVLFQVQVGVVDGGCKCGVLTPGPTSYQSNRGLSKKEAGELSVMCPKSIEQELESGTRVARWFALVQLRFKY